MTPCNLWVYKDLGLYFPFGILWRRWQSQRSLMNIWGLVIVRWDFTLSLCLVLNLSHVADSFRGFPGHFPCATQRFKSFCMFERLRNNSGRQCTPIHWFSHQIPTMVLVQIGCGAASSLAFNTDLPSRCQEPNYMIQLSCYSRSAFTFHRFLKETHLKQVALCTHYHQAQTGIA